jgi:Domain of unknown function (DUF4032)/Lipopolysaccharide kinase (Kdo/WaaP) family
VRFQLVTGAPDFLDLPWETPLARWESDRLVEVARGVGRHVVRFASYDEGIFALKELSPRVARREYDLLRGLAETSVTVVEATGIVSERGGGADDVLVTRHLDFSLPYRTLFQRHGVDELRDNLLDALVRLLVGLHSTGFFWGDCSLSNTLFRRDAGALSAYLVDAETGERHPSLSDGQRRHDVALAVENVAFELADLEAGRLLQGGIDPLDTAEEIARRYDLLWTELTRDELLAADERHRIAERLDQLHELGYDVDELELIAEGDGFRLRVSPRVVEDGFHARRLHALTGLNVQENQARRLLDDMLGFREEAERAANQPQPLPVIAHRWLMEAYEPALAAIPPGLRGKLEPAELYHQLLEHRWFLSERLGRCASMAEATASYASEVLGPAPDERLAGSHAAE